MSPDLRRVTRRRFLRVGGVGMVGVVLLGAAGCGAGGDGNGEVSGGARTIEHKYGTTEVSGSPERVVTVGLTEQDYVLALGIAPVGAREWFGEYPGALWPWARDKIGDDDSLPEILPVAELNFEQIAALETDLILGVNSGLTEQEYGTLSEIAPTVAQPKGYADYGAPWQEITRAVGLALGRSEQAEALMPDLEARFDRVRAEHPEFGGATGLLAAVVNDGSFYIYAEGPAPRFLTSLGLELPTVAAGMFSGDNRAPVQISQERLDVLEADVLVLGLYGADKASLTDNPIYQGLGIAREGRDILLPELSLANGALSFGSVLSLPTALDEMVPQLAAAIDGNTDTEPMPIPETEATSS